MWSGYTASSGYRYHDLNLRDFLAHKVGVPRYDAVWYLGGRTREGILEKIRHFKPITSPRVTFTYNNIYYLLAGKVAEEIADNGKNWESLIEEYFLKPLGMNNSGFYDKQENYKGFATPYVSYLLPDGTVTDIRELPFVAWRYK